MLSGIQSHVREMTKKAAKRLYFLVQLRKRVEVRPEELVQFYVACIRSVLLYGCMPGFSF